jgi:DNA polymerase III delta prime subunit
VNFKFRINSELKCNISCTHPPKNALNLALKLKILEFRIKLGKLRKLKGLNQERVIIIKIEKEDPIAPQNPINSIKIE